MPGDGWNGSSKKLPLLVACATWLLMATTMNHQRQVQGQELLSGQVQRLVEQDGSINMATILKHQRALEQECAKYHEAAINQYNGLEEMVGAITKPLSVKVPAVCLFLFSQFRKLEPWQEFHHQDRLDLVNWIYSDQEGNPTVAPTNDANNNNNSNNNNNNNSNKTKTKPSRLIKEYVLDPEVQAPKEVESAEWQQYHQDVEQMLGQDRFHQVINQNRHKLAAHLSPVVLIPGLLGSRLQARTDKTKSVNILCSKHKDWEDMWLSLKNLLPVLVDCWLDNVRLEFNEQTGFTKEPAGVESRVPDFGSVDSVRYLDVKKPALSSYYAELIDTYEQLGYTVDVNLLAAPYDFRLAPQQLEPYYGELKKLVEQAQASSPSNKKVTLVCHSMGCTHLLLFLRKQSPAWRQSHIRKMIALSSPWAGAAKAVKALVVGDRLDLPVVSENKMRQLARTYPSMAFLLPLAEVYARPSKTHADGSGPVLVETPQKKYRAQDMEQLLLDIGLEHQAQWFRQTTNMIKPLEPLPDLHVDCIHATNVPTPQTLAFEKQSDFPDGNYRLIQGDGDGTVNLESLTVCEEWSKTYPDKVRYKTVMNTNHVGLIKHKSTMTLIRDDVLVSEY